MYERERAGSGGIIGVIIGATIVIAIAFVFINGSRRFPDANVSGASAPFASGFNSIPFR